MAIITFVLIVIVIVFCLLLLLLLLTHFLHNGFTQESVHRAQLGQTRLMLQTLHISQPSAPMLDIVIGKPVIVFAIQDLVGVLAKEVSSILLNFVLNHLNLSAYNLIIF